MPYDFDRRRLRTILQAVSSLSVCLWLFDAKAAIGQIIPTNNWGAENSRLNPTSVVNGQPALTIEGGAPRGNNLFHSFQQFNINAGQRVYFANPSGVNTIFSRVIGGQASTISGTLGVNGAANLFLLNPQGIIFSPTAQLDIRGSFVSSTANSVIFGNQGQFQVAASTAPPLLTVSPSALEFVANQGAIINRASLENTNRNALLLLGSQVQLEGGRLRVPGGHIRLGGIQGNGTLALSQVGNQFQIVSLSGKPADVLLNSAAQLNVRSSDGGDINIQANDFTMQGPDTQLLAGIAENSGTAQSRSGDIRINATGAILLSNDAVINNSILAGAAGSTGNTLLTGNQIEFLNLSNITTELIGNGNLGDVRLQSRGDILFRSGRSALSIGPTRNTDGQFTRSGIARRIRSTGRGQLGQINIQAVNLSLLRGASIGTQIAGSGSTGDVLINLSNQLNLREFGGERGSANSISTTLETSANSNTGNVVVNARMVNIANGSAISTIVFGRGFAGNITIQAQDNVVVTGSTPARPRTLLSGISTRIQDSAVGESGNIKITAKNILISDGAAVSASSSGRGNSGDINLTAFDRIVIQGVNQAGFDTRVATSVSRQFFPRFGLLGRGAGKSGDISIAAKKILLLDGASVNAGIFNAPGEAGQIMINAQDEMRISGTGDGISFRLVNGQAQLTPIQLPTLLAASTIGDTNAAGGSITINTPRLIVDRNGLIDTETTSRGPGGNVNLNSAQIILESGGQIRTSTTNQGQAGSINIRNNKLLRISGKSATPLPAPEIPNSALLAKTTPRAAGDGGSIQLNSQQIVIENDGQISVSSEGTGVAGRLLINADVVKLRDRGQLLAETSSNTGGNILLNLSGVLLLRRGASISTTAGTAQSGGNGGQINIRSPFIVSVPNENSDIVANAFSGAGGQVNINALNLFGISPKTRIELEQLLNVSDPALLNPDSLISNDITAISQASPNLSGNVTVSQLDVDPTQAAARLPDDLLDRSNLLNQSLCRVTQGSQFVLTGRGGLPTPPTGQMRPLRLWEDNRITTAPAAVSKPSTRPIQSLHPQQTTPQPTSLVEAQTWHRNHNGGIQLTARANRPQGSWVRSPLCTAQTSK